MPAKSTSRKAAIDQLAHAAYQLSASDGRLRGRATRDPAALSLTHARALKSLADFGPMTIGALAERVATTSAAVTQLVSSLVKAGLVTRERADGGDRRVATVALTEAGRIRHIERQTHLEQALSELVADLDDAQVHTVSEVLRRLADLYDTL
ncbi:MarR family winged helix-turn-helix transcriptional regulator [Mycolicibacterium goodii]|uniref:MarR family winged helix-turn-helix transcriptional regulator n=1 Tax=Mycolicibacterium goodii TaxID=134601 RepID=UPI001BDCEA52|nr:MarR family transcriptional regulator [Mycolicibacterium goodii]MBU8830222.1 MarR family transcriptional regulator [Mycolicibacterium goodii]ULN46487.1 MarR family transcriptional regulator [Mycolicibacterium goodii]